MVESLFLPATTILSKQLIIGVPVHVYTAEQQRHHHKRLGESTNTHGYYNSTESKTVRQITDGRRKKQKVPEQNLQQLLAEHRAEIQAAVRDHPQERTAASGRSLLVSKFRVHSMCLALWANLSHAVPRFGFFGLVITRRQ